MKRTPLLLILTLIGIWLLLNGEPNSAQIAFATLLSVILVLAIARLRPVRPRVRRLYLALPLALHVFIDIMRSCVDVARIVLGLMRGERQFRNGFLDVPLELRDPHGLAILAVIVTSTPGTSWAGVSADGRTLRLHVLDLDDESEWIRLIKQRYERPLMRMFE